MSLLHTVNTAANKTYGNSCPHGACSLMEGGRLSTNEYISLWCDDKCHRDNKAEKGRGVLGIGSCGFRDDQCGPYEEGGLWAKT